MTESQTPPAAAAPAPTQPPPAPPPAPAAGKASRRGGLIVAALILGSLAWYVVADRITPYSSQARVQAFVVPVSAEVSGPVLKVHVRNNDIVRPGQPLFDIDPTQYQITLERSRADYEAVRLSVNASNATVSAARAALQSARANHAFARQDAARLEQIHAADPGAISVRRVESAQAARAQSEGREKAAEADLRRAIEMAGESGDRNAQIQSAKRAVEKAELDLRRTRVVAPSQGSVTDLRTDVGLYAQAGAPAMTLIAVHDLWISADMTENNLGHIQPGNEVAVVLDLLPGDVLKGRVRSVGTGIAPGKAPPPGTLPEVDNNRDWLRQAQRFPVAVEFEPSEREKLRNVRIGGQADVMVFTGDNPVMNWLGRVFIRLMAWLSFLY
jgi:multidrug resistance efflux pump